MPQTATLSEKQNCRLLSFFSPLLTGLSKNISSVSIFYWKENSQIFSIRHFLIFYDKKSWKTKIDINFQFLTLNENWMDEWPTDRSSLHFDWLSGVRFIHESTIFCSKSHLFLTQREWDSKTKQPIRFQG